jgi:hypothetical protein
LLQNPIAYYFANPVTTTAVGLAGLEAAAGVPVGPSSMLTNVGVEANAALKFGATEFKLLTGLEQRVLLTETTAIKSGKIDFYGTVGGELIPANAYEGTAYRAIAPAYADSTAASGQFYRSGIPGRLGNDGVYASSTVEGAIAEFQAHNPTIQPAVFEVKYPLGPTLKIDPPSGYFNSPLPFTQDANILEALSFRAPGTVNYLIRQGAVPGDRIK